MNNLPAVFDIDNIMMHVFYYIVRRNNMEEDIEFISEPLVTEDGFINELCIKQLEKAITNMPKTYERLANEEEWSKKAWIFRHEIVGALANAAVSLSPYPVPEGLERVLNYTDACLKRMVDWGEFEGTCMAELSLCNINKLLYDILYEQGISDFDEWNKSKKNWRESEHETFQEAEGSDPDYGFIDLDALLHYVCIVIRYERRDHKRFSDKFEKEWGHLEE